MNHLAKALFALALAHGSAAANAFNINEHDARVTGRGGATAASNEEPSAIVFNPGGIALTRGTSFAIGGSLYIAQGSYQASGGEKVTTDSSPAVVPNLYVTSRVHDMVAVGVGLHLPFGLAVSWPDNHAQRDIVQDQNLRTYFISPVVALNLHKQVPGLSIGVGADIVPATIELKQDVLFGSTSSGKALLAGDALGVGVRAGVMYHPPKVAGLKIGVMYRSPISLEFKGNGDFDAEDPFRSQLPPDGPISAKIKLPQTIWGGVAYGKNNFEAEANVVWINWGQTFPDGDLTINFTDIGQGTSQPQDYEDRVSYRLGLEYKLPAQKMAVRGGFIYDPTPIPASALTARLPDIDRKNITLGASRAFGSMAGHLGFLWVTPGKRSTSDADPYAPQFKGEYGVQAFVASLSLTGSFGAKPAADPAGSGAVAKR